LGIERLIENLKYNCEGRQDIWACNCLNKKEVSSKSLLGLDHSLDAIVHVLSEVDFGAAQSTEVRDVEDAVISLGVLSVSATDLHVVLVGNGLELVWVLSKLGELDMHGSTHASSEVGWARGDVAEMVVGSELSLSLDLVGSDGEALEDLTDV
jgi:hypothetical protein